MDNTTFTDSSVYTHTLTVNATTTNTTQYHTAPSSAKFNGSSSYLIVPEQTSELALNTNDFTIECWVNSASTTSGVILGRWGPVIGPYLIIIQSGNFLFYGASSNASYDIASAKVIGSVTANTWTHLAVTRQGSTFRTFKNGILGSTWTNSSAFWNNSPYSLVIGASSSPYQTFFNGYMDEVNIINGQALYTSNFTPN